MPQPPLGLLQAPWRSWEEKQQHDNFQRSITSEGQAAWGEWQNFTFHWLDKGAFLSFGEGSGSDFFKKECRQGSKWTVLGSLHG